MTKKGKREGRKDIEWEWREQWEWNGHRQRKGNEGQMEKEEKSKGEICDLYLIIHFICSFYIFSTIL